MSKIYVIKLGGQLITNPVALQGLLKQVGHLQTLGISPVLVHGGGPQLTEMTDRLGIETKMVNGRRITDRATLEAAKMVFAGKIRTEIVSMFVSLGMKAAGLSGFDGGLIMAKRREPQLIKDKITEKKELIDFGYVGDVVRINPELLHVLIGAGYIPVVSSLGVDEEGTVLNINADTIAGEIATALPAERIIYVTDVDGLYRDIKDPSSRIGFLEKADLASLIEEGGVVSGMLPKLSSILNILDKGVDHAHIVNAFKPNSLVNEILAKETLGGGTTFRGALQ
jgi:acetylglutamate kinase